MMFQSESVNFVVTIDFAIEEELSVLILFYVLTFTRILHFIKSSKPSRFSLDTVYI